MKKKLNRLLVVTQYFWPENFIINDLVSELAERGYEITILTGFPNYPSGKFFSEFRAHPELFSTYKGMKVVRVPIFPRGKSKLSLILNYFSFAISASFFGLWQLRSFKFDVIFTYQTSPVTVGIPALVFRKIRKIPMMLWVLDLWPDTLKAVGAVKSNFLLKITHFITYFIYNRCDLILTQSEAFIPIIKRSITSNNPVKYFPGWPDSEITKKTSIKDPQIKFDLFSFKIIFTGNIGDAQDFESILMAAVDLKKNTKIKWYIFGTGSQFKWVEEQIKILGLERVFFLMGAFPLETMPFVYSRADALLVTLRNQSVFSLTIPAKIQAYLAAGKPILAMLNGEGARVIENSKSGIVVSSGDYKALSAAVIRLSDLNPKRRSNMGMNGILYCNKKFNRFNLLTSLELYIKNI